MEKQCNCEISHATIIGQQNVGWEGSAILQNGSCIRFGCLKFIFCIPDNSNQHKNEEIVCSESSVQALKEQFSGEVWKSSQVLSLERT